MLLAQITDLHIGQPKENTYGVDVRHNFLMVLGELKTLDPDYIIITGDLCYEHGDLEIYRWIKTKMDNLDIPYLVIPGNHDDSEMMQEVFEIDFTQEEDEIFFAKRLGKHRALFLDSSKASMSDIQLKWLKRQLYQSADEHLLIFTHYPPVKAEVAFMDLKYSYKGSAEILEILSGYPSNIYLFCGHYHTDRKISINKLHIQISPAIICQIDPYSEDFKIDNYRAGYRTISIKKESLITSLHYLDGKMLKP